VPSTALSKTVIEKILMVIPVITLFHLLCFAGEMITDVQLAIFANVLGVSLFLLVVLYHYISVNNPKKSE